MPKEVSSPFKLLCLMTLPTVGQGEARVLTWLTPNQSSISIHCLLFSSTTRVCVLPESPALLQLPSPPTFILPGLDGRDNGSWAPLLAWCPPNEENQSHGHRHKPAREPLQLLPGDSPGPRPWAGPHLSSPRVSLRRWPVRRRQY